MRPPTSPSSKSRAGGRVARPAWDCRPGRAEGIVGLSLPDHHPYDTREFNLRPAEVGSSYAT